MGVWAEILKLGASGEGRAAREKLVSELPLSLREFVPSSEGLRQYRGPIPLAVRRFIANLPTAARALAFSHECDFVDYILEDVCAEVERTLLLMEICHRRPGATLVELKAVFPWAVSQAQFPRCGDEKMPVWRRNIDVAALYLFVLSDIHCGQRSGARQDFRQQPAAFR